MDLAWSRQIVETTSGLLDILDNTIDDWTDPRTEAPGFQRPTWGGALFVVGGRASAAKTLTKWTLRSAPACRDDRASAAKT